MEFQMAVAQVQYSELTASPRREPFAVEIWELCF